jgi:hypothetical protein
MQVRGDYSDMVQQLRAQSKKMYSQPAFHSDEPSVQRLVISLERVLLHGVLVESEVVRVIYLFFLYCISISDFPLCFSFEGAWSA